MSRITRIPVDNPWVCIDLDGTLMADGHYPKFGPPLPGAKEALHELHRLGIKVMVFTARTAITGLDGRYVNVNTVVEQICQWANEHGLEIDYVWPMPKPTFVLAFFDDKAIRLDDLGWGVAMQKFKETFREGMDWRKAVLPPETTRSLE